jgi:hypothetical protein
MRRRALDPTRRPRQRTPLNWLERSGNHGEPGEPALSPSLLDFRHLQTRRSRRSAAPCAPVDCMKRFRARASPMASAVSAPSERTKAVLLVRLEIE